MTDKNIHPIIPDDKESLEYKYKGHSKTNFAASMKCFLEETIRENEEKEMINRSIDEITSNVTAESMQTALKPQFITIASGDVKYSTR